MMQCNRSCRWWPQPWLMSPSELCCWPPAWCWRFKSGAMFRWHWRTVFRGGNGSEWQHEHSNPTSRGPPQRRADDGARLCGIGRAAVTTLIIMTAWCGYYFGALKSGLSSFSWSLFHTLLGIGLVSGGAGALNEVMEWDSE